MALTVVDPVTVIDVEANTAVVRGAVDEGDVEAIMVVQGKNCLTDGQAGWLICWLPNADSDHVYSIDVPHAQMRGDDSLLLTPFNMLLNSIDY